MSLNSTDEYWVPEHVREYLRSLGFVLPLDDMELWIRSRDDWLGARGDFYDYHDRDGAYRIVTVCFDHEGNEISPAGVAPVYDTGCAFPAFGIVKPAVTNTRVDMSPYGQSVFADAVDAVQAVGLTFDALVGEIGAGRAQ